MARSKIKNFDNKLGVGKNAEAADPFDFFVRLSNLDEDPEFVTSIVSVLKDVISGNTKSLDNSVTGFVDQLADSKSPELKMFTQIIKIGDVKNRVISTISNALVTRASALIQMFTLPSDSLDADFRISVPSGIAHNVATTGISVESLNAATGRGDALRFITGTHEVAKLLGEMGVQSVTGEVGQSVRTVITRLLVNQLKSLTNNPTDLISLISKLTSK
jgi:hypothetical protein